MMMRQKLFSYTLCWRTMVTTSHCGRFFAVSPCLGGPFETVSIVNWFVRWTRWSASNGHANTWQSPSIRQWYSMMSFGRMSARCSSKVTGDSAAESGESHQKTNKGKHVSYKLSSWSTVDQSGGPVFQIKHIRTYFPSRRAKHPVKVHVWAGIILRGRWGICVFEGKMNAPLYTSILDSTLVPFLQDLFPEHHRFMQDNNPKHTSKLARRFLVEANINWWKTPPELPDLNPIENLWHEFLRREIKLTNKQELVNGILAFWNTVDIAKCTKYIRHLSVPSVSDI